MKRISSILLAIMWSLYCTVPVFASDSGSTDAPEGELIFETITMGNEAMVIPVVIETTEPQTRMARSGETYQDVTQTATYYIPVTDDDIVYNENYVQMTQAARFSGTGTDQHPDPKHYVTMTSSIKYTLYNSLDGKTPDSLIGIDQVSITRSQDPVGLDWDILGNTNPSVEIKQIGLTDRGGGNGTGVHDQVVKHSNISWGSTGVKTPSNWLPIMLPDFYGVYAFVCSATYSVVFYYSDGSRTCEFTHNVK